MDRETFDGLSDRKKKVLLHLEKTLFSPLGNAQYIKTDKGDYDLDSVDFVLMEPSEEFDYFYLSTVGLSRYQFDFSFARSEIGIVLPKSFDRNLNKKENFWPLQLLSEIVFSSIDNILPITLNRIYLVTEEKREEFGENVGGVVTLPEIMDTSFIEEKIDDTYTRFYLLVPLTSSQVAKAQDIGVREFVEYDLHDVNGPLLVAKYHAPKINSTLQKIINHNEGNLRK